MLVCGNAISQTDIQKKNDSLKLVCIDTSIARKVANDLVDGDVCKAELKYVKNNLQITKDKLVLKDSIILGKDNQIGILNNMISLKDEKFNLEKDKSNEILKQLKTEKRKSFFYKVTSFLGVLSTLIVVITK
jgi:hypothetical protein